MKTRFLFLVLFLSMVTCSSALKIRKYPLLYQEKLTTGKLTVNVSNCKNSHGVVKLCIYNERKNYIEQRFPFREKSSLIKNKSAVFEFRQFPHGNYAIIAFHDRNCNGKLDLDIAGMPEERHGYSNNLNVFYGRPGFGEAKFNFSGEAMTLDIPLR